MNRRMKMNMKHEEGGIQCSSGGGKAQAMYGSRRCRPRAVDSVLRRYRVPIPIMHNSLVDQVPSTYPYAAVCAGVRVRPPGQDLRYWLHRSAWADLHLFDYFFFYFSFVLF